MESQIWEVMEVRVEAMEVRVAAIEGVLPSHDSLLKEHSVQLSSLEESVAEATKSLAALREEFRKGFQSWNSQIFMKRRCNVQLVIVMSPRKCQERILELEENQLVFEEGDNEAELEAKSEVVIDLAMEGKEADLTADLSDEKSTKEFHAEINVEDDLKVLGEVSSRYSCSSAKLLSLDPAGFLCALAKSPPPDPPYLHPRTPIKHCFTCLAAKPPQPDPVNVRGWFSNKPSKPQPPEPPDPCADTTIKWWFSQVSIMLLPSDPLYSMVFSKRKRIRAVTWTWGYVRNNVVNEKERKAELDSGYLFDPVGQAQFGEKMKKMDLGLFLATGRTSVLEAVRQRTKFPDLPKRQRICTVSRLFLPFMSFSRLFDSKAREGAPPWWEGPCLFAVSDIVEVPKRDSKGILRMALLTIPGNGLWRLLWHMSLLKAHLFETKDSNELYVLIRYVDHSVIIKACVDLNGIELGGEVLIAAHVLHPVHANPDALPMENGGESIFSLANMAIEEMLKDGQPKMEVWDYQTT